MQVGASKATDVAGGRGYLIAAILKANRKTRGILFDLPHVTSGAAELLRERGVADRCEIISGADAYIMKHIIHDWDDERAGQILRTCYRAMPSGAKLLLVDVVIPTGNGLRYGKLLDVEMLVLTPRGRERTGKSCLSTAKEHGRRYPLLRLTKKALRRAEELFREASLSENISLGRLTPMKKRVVDKFDSYVCMG